MKRDSLFFTNSLPVLMSYLFDSYVVSMMDWL